MPRGIQAIVEALAHETLLMAAFPHAFLNTLARDRATHPMGSYTLASQHTPETGCNKMMKMQSCRNQVEWKL